jgi:hypothetical protein
MTDHVATATAGNHDDSGRGGAGRGRGIRGRGIRGGRADRGRGHCHHGEVNRDNNAHAHNNEQAHNVLDDVPEIESLPRVSRRGKIMPTKEQQRQATYILETKPHIIHNHEEKQEQEAQATRGALCSNKKDGHGHGYEYLIVTDHCDAAFLQALERLRQFHNGTVLQVPSVARLQHHLELRRFLTKGTYTGSTQQKPRRYFVAIAPRFETSYTELMVLGIWKLLLECSHNITSGNHTTSRRSAASSGPLQMEFQPGFLVASNAAAFAKLIDQSISHAQHAHDPTTTQQQAAQESEVRVRPVALSQVRCHTETRSLQKAIMLRNYFGARQQQQHQQQQKQQQQRRDNHTKGVPNNANANNNASPQKTHSRRPIPMPMPIVAVYHKSAIRKGAPQLDEEPIWNLVLENTTTVRQEHDTENDTKSIRQSTSTTTTTAPTTFLKQFPSDCQRALQHANLWILHGHGTPGMSCSIDIDALGDGVGDRNGQEQHHHPMMDMTGKVLLLGSCYAAAPPKPDFPPFAPPAAPRRQGFMLRAIDCGALCAFGHLRQSVGFPHVFAILEQIIPTITRDSTGTTGNDCRLTIGEAFQRLINALLAIREFTLDDLTSSVPPPPPPPKEDNTNGHKHGHGGGGGHKFCLPSNVLLYVMIGDPALTPF